MAAAHVRLAQDGCCKARRWLAGSTHGRRAAPWRTGSVATPGAPIQGGHWACLHVPARALHPAQAALRLQDRTVSLETVRADAVGAAVSMGNLRDPEPFCVVTAHPQGPGHLPQETAPSQLVGREQGRTAADTLRAGPGPPLGSRDQPIPSASGNLQRARKGREALALDVTLPRQGRSLLPVSYSHFEPA